MSYQCNILILDDERIVGDRLKTILGKYGHHVEVFTNPLNALKCLEEKNIDIVISDIRMPEMDGIQVMNWISQRSKDTKVIMITGYATLELARESLTKGAFDFIAKPFKAKEIRQTIQKAAAALNENSSRISENASA
ncbi:MAG: response regulator [Deltaproteobacteria bacterium]|jgi:DNA-binding NtrC family response regulator|nr:response regulator [Deltaproteobacteria bacterium]